MRGTLQKSACQQTKHEPPVKTFVKREEALGSPPFLYSRSCLLSSLTTLEEEWKGSCCQCCQLAHHHCSLKNSMQVELDLRIHKKVLGKTGSTWSFLQKARGSVVRQHCSSGRLNNFCCLASRWQGKIGVAERQLEEGEGEKVKPQVKEGHICLVVWKLLEIGWPWWKVLVREVSGLLGKGKLVWKPENTTVWKAKYWLYESFRCLQDEQDLGTSVLEAEVAGNHL